jgi:hypothetical protein
MTTRGLKAVVLAGAVVAGCGGTTQSLRANETADPRHGPRAPRTYTFERELVRLRRDERNVTVVRGTLGVDVPDAAGPHAIRVLSARYTQGNVVVRELDPALGGEPVDLVQEMDGRGGAASLGADVEMLLGSEITQVLDLIPIGSCGIAPLDGESATFVLGFEGDQGVPREFPARCTRRAMAGVGHSALSCEASLDRSLEVSNEARSQGITASLEGRATLDATLDVATGLCTSATHHVELTVVERMGAYEERETVTIDVRTTLEDDD